MNTQIQIDGNKLLKVHVGKETKNLLVLRNNGTTRPFFEPHALVENINKQYGTALRIISLKTVNATFTTTFDKPLTFFYIWKELPSFPINTLIAYEQPNIKLKNEIIFSNMPKIVLQTGDFIGEKNIALIVSNLTLSEIFFTMNKKIWPLTEILKNKELEYLMAINLEKEVEKIIFVPFDRKITLVKNFPKQDGWYMQDPKTGIPYGERFGAYADKARYLIRASGSYVGPIISN